LLQGIVQGHEIEKRAIGIEVDKKVEIAFWPLVSAGAGSEHANVSRAVLLGNLENRLAIDDTRRPRHGLPVSKCTPEPPDAAATGSAVGWAAMQNAKAGGQSQPASLDPLFRRLAIQDI
jgi:hypothetical protein